MRILLAMIFSMTKAIQPNENVSEQEIAPINQLIEEVRSQKEKIHQLGTIISSQIMNQNSRSMGPQPTSPSHAGTDLWELAKMEEEEASIAAYSVGNVNRTSANLVRASLLPHLRCQ